jgi:NADH:ubiquinone oxidoreductase subunit 4 (subunit M)
LLAAIILKIATYGLFRFILLFFPIFSQFFSPLILIFGFFSFLFGSITTLRQIDLKSIIAYSSIVHMSLSLMGQFSSSFFGLFGAYYTMFSHAFISSGLFILIGCLYNRYHSRILDYFRGLSLPMPLFSSFFLIFSFANMSIPLSAAFIGEFYLLKGILDFNFYFSFFLAFGLFFSSLFMLFFTNRILFGSLSPFLSSFNDLNIREFFTLLPLLFFSLFFGLNSNPLLFFGLNSLLLLLPL